LRPDRKRKTILLLKSTKERMRLKSKNWRFRLKSLPSWSQKSNRNLIKKWLKLRLLRLNLTRQLRNSNDSILKDISFIFNGQKLSRTLLKETNTLQMLEECFKRQSKVWKRKSRNTRTTKRFLKELRTIMLKRTQRIRDLSEPSSKAERILTKKKSKKMNLKEKLQFLETNFQTSLLN